jgi:hypothetical protein
MFGCLYFMPLGLRIYCISVSGKMSWEQVLRYTRLQKRYIFLYASLLKSDPSQVTISGNKEIEDLDRELDIELILQWRYNVILDFCLTC